MKSKGIKPIHKLYHKRSLALFSILTFLGPSRNTGTKPLDFFPPRNKLKDDAHYSKVSDATVMTRVSPFSRLVTSFWREATIFAEITILPEVTYFLEKKYVYLEVRMKQCSNSPFI